MKKQKSTGQSTLGRIWWGALIGMVLSISAGLVLFETPLGRKLLYRSYDLPFQFRPTRVSDDAVMVYLDEASYRVLEQPFNAPWDRALHARLLERLVREGAASVMYDIVFTEPGPNPKADEDFAAAIKAHGRVVLGADYVAANAGVSGVKINQLYLPFEEFAKGAHGIGSVEMYVDDDGVNRQHLPPSSDDAIPSISWAAAKAMGARAATNSRIYSSERWVNYYGPEFTIPNTSLYKALDLAEVPAGYFSNKFVFIGAHQFTVNWGERKDQYPTPYPRAQGESKFMPGVEIQATIALNIFHNDWLKRLSRPMEFSLFIIMGVTFGLGLVLLRPVTATIVAVVSALGIAAAHQYIFTAHHYWFPWMMIVVGQIPAALAWAISYNSVQLYVEKRLLEQSLEKYLSPKRVKQLVNRRELLAPGAEKQMLTILFSDIENFTVLSEGVDSDDLAKLMNNYFETAVTDCIFKTDGTVVKYIGDAIFSFWNAPEDQQDHQARACEAALLLSRQEIVYVKDGRTQKFRTRVGLHTGVANVGNFGSATRIDYTAIGENINLASRMEGLNKYLGTSVLITGETHAGMGAGFIFRLCGNFQLKGFERAVPVYEIVGMPDVEEATKAWREAFATALDHFKKADFDAAEAGFRCVLQVRPDDGPSKFYLKEITELRQEPPEAGWQGEVELKDK
jgi:adenylate cyclase